MFVRTGRRIVLPQQRNDLPFPAVIGAAGGNAQDAQEHTAEGPRQERAHGGTQKNEDYGPFSPFISSPAQLNPLLIPFCPENWSGRRESNPRGQFGRLELYH